MIVSIVIWLRHLVSCRIISANTGHEGKKGYTPKTQHGMIIFTGSQQQTGEEQTCTNLFSTVHGTFAESPQDHAKKVKSCI